MQKSKKVHKYVKVLTQEKGIIIQNAVRAIRCGVLRKMQNGGYDFDRGQESDQKIRQSLCCKGSELQDPQRKDLRIARPERRGKIHNDEYDDGVSFSYVRNGEYQRLRYL